VTAAVLETVPRYTDFLHPNGGSLVTLSTVQRKLFVALSLSFEYAAENERRERG